MVRPTKYKKKTESICLSLDPEVLDIIKRIADEHKKSPSELVTDILRTIAINDYEYARMKAKAAWREFYYWKGEKERIAEQ